MDYDCGIVGDCDTYAVYVKFVVYKTYLYL